MQKQFGRFYWPLAATGLVMLLGRQFQNGVLARFEDAARELATFTLAGMSRWSTMCSLITAGSSTSALDFVFEMTRLIEAANRSPQVSFRRCMLLCFPANSSGD